MPRRSIVFPLGNVHPHAGASGNGMQVPSCPGTNEHSHNTKVAAVNFITSSWNAKTRMQQKLYNQSHAQIEFSVQLLPFRRWVYIYTVTERKLR